MLQKQFTKKLGERSTRKKDKIVVGMSVIHIESIAIHTDLIVTPMERVARHIMKKDIVRRRRQKMIRINLPKSTKEGKVLLA